MQIPIHNQKDAKFPGKTSGIDTITLYDSSASMSCMSLLPQVPKGNDTLINYYTDYCVFF